MNEERTTAVALDPDRLVEMISGGEAQLIDVRQDFEWDAGRIPGASHIPLERLPSRAAEIDRDRPVVFVCRSGARSAMATEALRASGFDAHNLEGGMELWVERGMEIEPDGGTVAKPRHDNS